MILADEAIQFMRHQVESDNRFLSVVWFSSPHRPQRATERGAWHVKQEITEKASKRTDLWELDRTDQTIAI